ncbi:uncharacterized protein LOC134219240 [Armigeres subalbatus]|uniref:uncharacterized protein LOC134219240 n=1 Tax=Armigeres subalbatus TaxID=124917 RepID=UPI002ED60489
MVVRLIDPLYNITAVCAIYDFKSFSSCSVSTSVMDSSVGSSNVGMSKLSSVTGFESTFGTLPMKDIENAIGSEWIILMFSLWRIFLTGLSEHISVISAPLLVGRMLNACQKSYPHIRSLEISGITTVGITLVRLLNVTGPNV